MCDFNVLSQLVEKHVVRYNDSTNRKLSFLLQFIYYNLFQFILLRYNLSVVQVKLMA